MPARRFSVVLIINNGRSDVELPLYLTEALAQYAKEGVCRHFVHVSDVTLDGGPHVVSPSLNRQGEGSNVQTSVFDMLSQVVPKDSY